MTQGFKKHEHLKSRKQISELFNSGKSHKAFPLIAVYQKTDESAVKVGFSVSKRKIKLAKDRNTLKRRMREAYRLNRLANQLQQPTKGLSVMFIYIKNDMSDYQAIEKGMKRLLKKMEL